MKQQATVWIEDDNYEGGVREAVIIAVLDYWDDVLWAGDAGPGSRIAFVLLDTGKRISVPVEDISIGKADRLWV